MERAEPTVLHAPPQRFRHEWKHEINACDSVMLQQRLRAVAKPDPHAKNGKYRIRSLYFDNVYDRALREKVDGVNCREKFRIRYYNGDTSFIHLEKKSKQNGLCSKESAPLTAEEAQSLVNGDMEWMRESPNALIRELQAKMNAQGLRPKTIVDYTRIPFIYGPGNVRVTLDYDIRTGLHVTDLLDWDCVTVPAGDAPIILEVKWDAYLPDIIRDAVQLDGRHVTSFSKYAQCRVYG